MKHLVRDRAAVALAMGLGAGLMPVAPGTAGSALALPIAWACFQGGGTLGLALGTIIVTALGFWACRGAERVLGEHDSPKIVIDEMAGQLLTVLPLTCSWPHLIVGFGFFRLFDVLKPWPAGWIDREVEGGVGVMLDDLAAGIYACGATSIMVHSGVIEKVLKALGYSLGY